MGFERYEAERSRYSDSEVRRLVRRFLIAEMVSLLNEDISPEARMFVKKSIRHLVLKDAHERKMRGEALDRTIVDIVDRSGAFGSGGKDGTPLKQIGPFLVVEVEAEEDYSLGDFQIREGETYLELHAPVVEPEQVSLGKIRTALSEVSEHIESSGITPKYVMGVAVTAEGKKMGKLAERMGFRTQSLPLPGKVYNQLKVVNQKIESEGMYGESISYPTLIYQDTDKFINNFPPTS